MMLVTPAHYISAGLTLKGAGEGLCAIGTIAYKSMWNVLATIGGEGKTLADLYHGTVVEIKESNPPVVVRKKDGLKHDLDKIPNAFLLLMAGLVTKIAVTIIFGPAPAAVNNLLSWAGITIVNSPVQTAILSMMGLA